MYSYELERPKLLTDEGQKLLFATKKNIDVLLESAGAFLAFKSLKNVDYGDSFMAMAILDRLVELNEIKEVTSPNVSGQDRVFIKA
jgi:hypothetical protein